MQKFRKILAIFWYTMLAVVVLLLALALVLQLPVVQTRIVKKLTDRVARENFDAVITFDKIQFTPFNTFVINNIAIVDKSPFIVDTLDCSPALLAKFRDIGTEKVDTLFSAGTVVAKFSPRGIFGSSVVLGSVSVTDGQFNLVIEDGDYKTNLNRIFKMMPGRNKEVEDKENLHIRDVKTERFRFTMKSYRSRNPHVFKEGIDWNDLDVRNIHARGRHLCIMGKIVSGELDFASFAEKSGYVVESVSGRTRTGRGRASIDEIRIKDPWSDIYVSNYSMIYNSPKDFRDYVDKVRMEGTIKKTSLGLTTLGYFARALHNAPDFGIDIESGLLNGTVRDFTIDTLVVASAAGNLHGGISGRVQGLPKLPETEVAMNVDSLVFTFEGLQDIIATLSPKASTKLNLGKFAPDETFRMNARMEGRADSVAVAAGILSGYGEVGADAVLRENGRSTRIDGSVWTSDLDIRKVTGKTPIGPVSMSSDVSVLLGNGRRTVMFESLDIDRLNFNGYDYAGIFGSGQFNDRQLEVSLTADDPSLKCSLDGLMTFGEKGGQNTYRVDADIAHADLNAMNFDRRGESGVTFNLDAEIATNADATSGKVNIRDVMLENANGSYDIGDIDISSELSDGKHRIGFKSRFAEASYVGSGSAAAFLSDLKDITARKELPALFKDAAEEPSATESGPEYELSLRTLETSGLLSFIAPGLFASEGTLFTMEVHPDRNIFGKINSQRIAFKENFIRNLDMQFDNAGGKLSAGATIAEIKIAALKAMNNRIDMLADDNHISAGFSYRTSGDLTNEGEVLLQGELSRNDDGNVVCDVDILPSSLYVDSEEWNILPSRISLLGKDVSIGNFDVRSGKQAISARGMLSKRPADTLSVNLDQFNIAMLNPLLGNRFDLHGAVTGFASTTATATGRGILLDMAVDSTAIGGTYLGDLNVSSNWDENLRRFNIYAGNVIDGRKNIGMGGFYSPSNHHIDMQASLDSVDIGFARPFVEKMLSDISGYLSGKVIVSGDTRNLSIGSSGTRLDNAFLKVAFTNVGYNIDGPFHLDNDGLHFDSMAIRDRFGETGSITGKVGYDHFKDINLGIKININRIEVLDLAEKDNSSFYGHLFASGNVGITGPMNAIVLSADAITSKPGELHIPIASSMTAGESEILKFKKDESDLVEDPYEVMVRDLRGKEAAAKDFSVRLNVTANQDVEAFVELDKSGGNVINAQGSGVLDLDINPGNGRFDVKGDYTISRGNVHFVVFGIAARDFVINDGSTIRFNGNMKESALNIDATYRTKASIAPLISDTTSTYGNRRAVECGIKITEKLSSPRLDFSINIPDLDPTVKARVDNALSTDDKVQKQFLYLLLSGSFLPDEQSGIVNNSNALLTNVSDMMLGQLNSIFQKLNIPIDLGLNYQQNTRGNNVFDVAVSTQLFNNRVIISGNIGNRPYSTGSTSSDIVGDVDIEIKINRSGAFRLNLFSHSADPYTNYLDNSQRNGVGVAFGQEFNSFKEFFSRMFMGRKRREQEELKDIERAQNEEKRKISIQSDKSSKSSKKKK